MVRSRNFAIASTAGRGASETQAASRKVLSKSPGKCWRAWSIDRDLTTEDREGSGELPDLQSSGLFAASCLDLDVDVNQGHSGGSYPWNARGLAEGLRRDVAELLLHFAGEAADRTVVEPLGDVALLGLFQAVDGPLLLVEIAGIFDFGFERLEFVTDVGGQGVSGWRLVIRGADEEIRCECAEGRGKLFDRNIRALQDL